MVSSSAFSLKGGGWYGDGYNVKADETPKSEAESAGGTGATADSAPTDSAPKDSAAKETTASPATSSDQSQPETKNVVAEKPAATEKPKSEQKK
jgi:hypothetical protein